MAQTASDLVAMLRRRHNRDQFDTEVMCGPAGSRRLDGWAMRRAWGDPQTIGYEIKVTVADWRQDTKFLEYRQFVHELWLVSPWGIIKPEEVPTGVGLLWATRTGSRFATKVKAAGGQPSDWFVPIQSLLINRNVERPRGSTRRELIDEYLADKDADGYRAVALGERWRNLVGELRQARSKVEAYDQLSERAAKIGRTVRGVFDAGLSPDGMDPRQKRSMRFELGQLERALGRLKGIIGEEAETETDDNF